MEKKPFVTLEKLQEIVKDYPTPFHLYDERGIRENARKLREAFAWNKGFKEYFAVKATPNPFILKILKEEGCGTDCSSLTELMMSDACGFCGTEIMFSSNDTPPQGFSLPMIWGRSSIWMISPISGAWRRLLERFRRRSAAGTIREACLRSAMISWTIPGMPSMA